MTVLSRQNRPRPAHVLAAGVKGGEKGLLKKSAEGGTGSGGATGIRE